MVFAFFALLSFLALSMADANVTISALRGNKPKDATFSTPTVSSVLCHVMNINVEFATEKNSDTHLTAARSEKEPVCVVATSRLEGIDNWFSWTYRLVGLPEHVKVDLNHDNALWIRISNAIRHNDAATLEISQNATVKVVQQPKDAVSFLGGTTPSSTILGKNRRFLTPAYQNMGTSKVLVLRIQYLDYYPNVTADDLRGQIFGLGPNLNVEVNVRRQMKHCSFGKLTLRPADIIPIYKRSLGSSPIVQGVAEMHITKAVPSSRNSARALENVVIDRMVEWYGQDYIKEHVNHIMLVFPDVPDVLKFENDNYLAYAMVRGKLSVYNNYWSVSISSVMHELGHNLNLAHAGEHLSAYGDKTGYMGFGLQKSDYLRSCYNAQKHWFLGWYQDRSRTLVVPTLSSLITRGNQSDLKNDTELLPWTSVLAAFVDYDAASIQQLVILQIETDNQDSRYYLQYNRAKKFNRDTREYRDQVVIIEEEGTLEGTYGIQSWLVGAIQPPPVRTKAKPGEHQLTFGMHKVEGRGLSIQVCNQTRGHDVEFVSISIFLDGQVSGCTGGTGGEQSQIASPNQNPSTTYESVPTPQPSHFLLVAPSNAPSQIPTTQPTEMAPIPAYTPTENVTISPSQLICEDSTEKFKLYPTSKGYIQCPWLARNPQIVTKKQLCDPNNEQSSAHTFCPDTCNICFDGCFDNLDRTFYVNEEWGHQNCLWLATRPNFMRKICVDNHDANHLCRETCNACVSKPICEDSAPNRKFWIRKGFDNVRQRNCVWLSRRTTEEQIKWCNDGDVTDPETPRHVCPETCGSCDDLCEDDPNVSFFVNKKQGKRNCEWLSTRPGWKEILCEPGFPSFEHCKESCNACGL